MTVMFYNRDVNGVVPGPVFKCLLMQNKITIKKIQYKTVHTYPEQIITCSTWCFLKFKNPSEPFTFIPLPTCAGKNHANLGL